MASSSKSSFSTCTSSSSSSSSSSCRPPSPSSGSRSRSLGHMSVPLVDMIGCGRKTRVIPSHFTSPAIIASSTNTSGSKLAPKPNKQRKSGCKYDLLQPHSPRLSDADQLGHATRRQVSPTTTTFTTTTTTTQFPSASDVTTTNIAITVTTTTTPASKPSLPLISLNSARLTGLHKRAEKGADLPCPRSVSASTVVCKDHYPKRPSAGAASFVVEEKYSSDTYRDFRDSLLSLMVAEGVNGRDDDNKENGEGEVTAKRWLHLLNKLLALNAPSHYNSILRAYCDAVKINDGAVHQRRHSPFQSAYPSKESHPDPSSSRSRKITSGAKGSTAVGPSSGVRATVTATAAAGEHHRSCRLR